MASSRFSRRSLAKAGLGSGFLAAAAAAPGPVREYLLSEASARQGTPEAALTPREHHRVLFVGRLTTEKHVEVTLAAVAKLAPELPNITFDIVGGGDQRRPGRGPRPGRRTARVGLRLRAGNQVGPRR